VGECGSVIVEDSIEQARKTRFEIIATERQEDAPPTRHHTDQTSFPQHFELVRACRFWHPRNDVNIAATDRIAGMRQLCHNIEAHWVAQGVQNVWQG